MLGKGPIDPHLPYPATGPLLAAIGRSSFANCGQFSQALRYKHRIVSQHREPVVHSLGIRDVPPVGKQPRGISERQPAFYLVDLQREGQILRAGRLESC